MASMFLGSSVSPLILIEVVPVVFPGFHPDTALPSVSAPFVKFELLRQAFRSNLSSPTGKSRNNNLVIIWDKTETSAKVLHKGRLALFEENTKDFPRRCTLRSGKNIPLIYLSSQDPTLLKPWPCFLLGFCAWRPPQDASASSVALVTNATLVRIVPLQIAVDTGSQLPEQIPFPHKPWSDHRSKAEQWRHSFTGEVENMTTSPKLLEEVLHNHDPETIDALMLRMSSLLSVAVTVGTTNDAFSLQRRWNKRRENIRHGVETIFGPDKETNDIAETVVPSPSLLAEGSLIVHSPDHASGKTLLVQSIARNRLNCLVHVIHPGPWLAKYGVQADAALESLLHSIVVGAAALDKPICIILDGLDAFLPPSLSGRSGAGDAAIPALHGIASVIKHISLSIQRRSQFPFPMKNAMYNLGGKGGMVLPVRVCLVGVVTCLNDVGRSRRGDSHGLVTVLDSMMGGRFLLPPLSVSARIKAFQHSLEMFNIKLTDEAESRLPFIAASSTFARGSAFQTFARRLRATLDKKTSAFTDAAPKATLQDVEQSIAIVRTNATRSSSVSFAGESKAALDKGVDVFESVGGNALAKRALQDALALDPKVAQHLAKFGMSPPTGVLLYGPPGCGKTLLARSVANLLKSSITASTTLGGAFISLSASSIVQAEVGTSEKLVTASFETARANAPAVIFIDEFQALFTDRQGMGSGRLSSTLLQCMDDVKLWSGVDYAATANKEPSLSPNGMETTQTNRILVLGATNTPWLVDKAFLRPGRFDRVVHVSLPSLSERRAIIRVHVGCMRTSFRNASAEFEAVCESVANKTDGFSGADLAALCRAAAVRCLKEFGRAGCVEERHFLKALDYGDVRASSNSSLVKRLNMWRPQH